MRWRDQGYSPADEGCVSARWAALQERAQQEIADAAADPVDRAEVAAAIHDLTGGSSTQLGGGPRWTADHPPTPRTYLAGRARPRWNPHDEGVDPFSAARAAFRGRVSGDPSGAPEWVREIGTVGDGEGWFDPDGVVWRVHGDLSTLVGGVAALLGQGAHPLALAGVQRHSAYREDPWKRLAGTARWLVVSTFGSAALAERESARVRGMHRRVRGTLDDGRAYSAGDPDLLRWVHLAFTDAFLAAQTEVGRDMSRFGPRWADTYVREWARTAQALGATDLPHTEVELAEAIAGYRPVLEPVPADLLAFLSAPPGLSGAERVVYSGFSAGAALLVSPTVAPLAGVPGRSRRGLVERGQLTVTRAQLRALNLALGQRSPSEEAARWRLGTGPAPAWAA